MDFRDRAAHNEEIFRQVNARIEEGAQQHQVRGTLPFHCECSVATCIATIELDPSDYDRIASDSTRFVVVPGHERPEFERVLERHPDHFVVEKIGEARAEIDREHPRRRHGRREGS